MNKAISYLVIGILVTGLVLAQPALLVANAVNDGAASSGGSRVIAVLGIAKVQGEDAIVEILVEVQRGKDPSDVARQAIQAQGARPFDSANLGSAGFTLTGLVWDNLPVVQNYNNNNEPFTTAKTALTSTHTAWDGVDTSDFNINIGQDTTRCPSLVLECPEEQSFDGNNDVAWLTLGSNTLGVTWFGTSTDETDMALNTEFSWSADCLNVNYNAQTVFLHENGHVVGLGHSDDAGSVMQPFYNVANCDLGTDDEEGTTYLYDSTITGIVYGTVYYKDKPVKGATVLLAGISLKTTTGADGTFSISGVPDPVTYDIKASYKGKKWEDRITIDGSTEIQIILSKGGGGGGDDDGGGPPKCVPKKFC